MSRISVILSCLIFLVCYKLNVHVCYQYFRKLENCMFTFIFYWKLFSNFCISLTESLFSSLACLFRVLWQYARPSQNNTSSLYAARCTKLSFEIKIYPCFYKSCGQTEKILTISARWRIQQYWLGPNGLIWSYICD